MDKSEETNDVMEEIWKILSSPPKHVPEKNETVTDLKLEQNESNDILDKLVENSSGEKKYKICYDMQMPSTSKYNPTCEENIEELLDANTIAELFSDDDFDLCSIEEIPEFTHKVFQPRTIPSKNLERQTLHQNMNNKKKISHFCVADLHKAKQVVLDKRKFYVYNEETFMFVKVLGKIVQGPIRYIDEMDPNKNSNRYSVDDGSAVIGCIFTDELILKYQKLLRRTNTNLDYCLRRKEDLKKLSGDQLDFTQIPIGESGSILQYENHYGHRKNPPSIPRINSMNKVILKLVSKCKNTLNLAGVVDELKIGDTVSLIGKLFDFRYMRIIFVHKFRKVNDADLTNKFERVLKLPLRRDCE